MYRYVKYVHLHVNTPLIWKKWWLKKIYDQPRQHIKKQRHYLLTKVHIVKAMTFLVVTYRYESWTITKAGYQRIDAFEL